MKTTPERRFTVVAFMSEMVLSLNIIACSNAVGVRPATPASRCRNASTPLETLLHPVAVGAR
jgi:hypothetical protein